MGSVETYAIVGMAIGAGGGAVILIVAWLLVVEIPHIRWVIRWVLRGR